MAQQGSPPRRSARPLQPDHRGRHDGSSPGARPNRADRQQLDPFGPDSDDNLPPWAGPNDYPARPASSQRHGAAGRGTTFADEAGPEGYDDPVGDNWQADGGLDAPPAGTERPRRRGRAAATRLRKSRRRVYRWGGIAIVACIVAAGLTALLTHHTPKPSLYVTSLLPGEYKSVPNACGVSHSVLSQYLPGGARTASEISDSTQSQCSFTLDRKPNFLVLEVSAEAYQPFAAASAAGSAAGSASADAQDSYELAQANLRKPPARGKAKPLLSAAKISPLANTGEQAFVAIQTEHVGGIVTDVVTVVIRDRNVLVTVSESGQESGGGFGPVAEPTLQAGAEAAAKDILAKSLAGPRV